MPKGGRRKGAGRRPKPERPSPVSLRLDPTLRNALQQAAAEAGRSLSAEMIRRMKDSFSPKVENPETRALSYLIQEIAGTISRTSGRQWWSDRWGCETLKLAIGKLLDDPRIAPEGNSIPAEGIEAEMLATVVVRLVLAKVETMEPPGTPIPKDGVPLPPPREGKALPRPEFLHALRAMPKVREDLNIPFQVEGNPMAEPAWRNRKK